MRGPIMLCACQHCKGVTRAEWAHCVWCGRPPQPVATEQAADSPVGGVSGRILGSPAERSGAGNQGSTDGQSRVPRRSDAEPGNTKDQHHE